jgi:NTP pyrophosphatase (non-canonical NTP hydrolase)
MLTVPSKMQNDPPKKDKDEIASEVADVFIYLLGFCQENEINLLEVASKKIDHNSKKYPAKTIKNGGLEAYEKAKKDFRTNY